METNIFNIDSKFRNITTNPNSANFVFNKMEETIGGTRIIEPFNEKNVIEMKISSLELPNTIYYISTTRGNNKLKFGNNADTLISEGSYTIYELVNTLNGLDEIDAAYSDRTYKITINNKNHGTLTFPTSGTGYPSLGDILGFASNASIDINNAGTGTNAVSLPQQSYLFLRINDFGNIINKNRRYVGKIILDNLYGKSNNLAATTPLYLISNQFKLVTNIIKFDQPTDIQSLNISLEDEYGNIVSLNGSNWSFTLETTVITNTILKNYAEIKFYNDAVMDKILKAKMFSYYEKHVDPCTNSTLTSSYSSNLVNLNNVQEFTPFGSRNNYSQGYSYFADNDKRM